MTLNRKKFIAKAGIASLVLTTLSSFKKKSRNSQMKNIFYHHVFFWLKNAQAIADRNKLVEGLTKLSAVKTIKKFHIGKPANTSRNVIDSSYAISWLVEFANEADQASYQTDPVHLKFINDYSYLWHKVQVYDSVDI